MSKERLPSQEYLNQRLNYDANSGALIWKTRPLEHFCKPDRAFAISHRLWGAWNGRYSGTPAGGLTKTKVTKKTPYPNATVTIDHRGYAMGIIIWKMAYDVKVSMVGHINGNHTDFRLDNLCLGNTVRRRCVKGIPRKHTRRDVVECDLPKGVYRFKDRFRSKISVRDKSIHLGMFDTVEQAQAAYMAAVQRYQLG